MKKTIWPGRRASMAFGTAIVLVASSFALSGTSGASHTEVSLAGSNFEIDRDANLKLDYSTHNDGAADDDNDDDAQSIDWMTVEETRKRDTASGSGDESFGQGTKEDTPAPTVVTGGIPPNKSDLKWFGVHQEGTTASGFLNLFWARVQDPSGTTNMDFEFNQKKCEYVAGVETEESDCSPNKVTPLRTAGDLLITYDLSRGGSLAELSLREWVGDGTTGVWGPEDDLTASNTARGSINTSAIPVGEDDGLGALSPRTFGEAQLALSAIFDPEECKSFGSAYLKSRASDSFPAALKDFVPPVGIDLSNCGSIRILKRDNSTPANALEGAEFTLYHNEAPLTAPLGVEDEKVDGDRSTAVIDDWTCTSDALGVCDFNDVALGDYWLVETVTPTGYTTAANQAVSVTAADTTVQVTIVDPRQPGTINVQKTDDTGAALAGATFTLYPDLAPVGGTIGANDLAGTPFGTTCGPTLAAGSCSIASVPLGQYWLVETTTPAGYTTAAPQNVNLTTGGQTVNLTFSNPRLFKIIVLVCQEGNNTLYASNVQFDSTGTPANNNSLGEPPAGLTNAQLCGLGGATHSGGTGPHRADVTIP